MDGGRFPTAIDEALAALNPAIRKAFMDAIAQMVSAVQIGLLEDAIRAGDIQRAWAVLQIGPAYFARMDRVISEAHWQAGSSALAALPKLTDPASGQRVVVGFNGRHPRAEAWSRDRAGNLIEGIDGIVPDMKQGVRAFIEAGVEQGQGPAKVARDIVGRVSRLTGKREGGILGLNSQQVDWVIKARAELNDPAKMANYLTRTRRDARFDKIVRAAMQAGKPVSQADAERIIGRYNDRLLQLRGETIARTESITAMRAGKHEAYQQLVESGKVRADQIIRTWRATNDNRTRLDHAEMGSKSIRGMGPWTMPDGSLVNYPGDQSMGASARETINCRCMTEYQIDRRGTF